MGNNILINKKMRFAVISALIASASPGTVVNLVLGWPLGEHVDITPTIPTQAGSGGTNTWGCCTYTYDAVGSATGACHKSLAYSTNLCKIDCTSYETREICTAAQDTDRL